MTDKQSRNLVFLARAFGLDEATWLLKFSSARGKFIFVYLKPGEGYFGLLHGDYPDSAYNKGRPYFPNHIVFD